jgi:hypothetical protein
MRRALALLPGVLALALLALPAPAGAALPSPAADRYRTQVDVPLEVPAARGVLANDTDADGDPLVAGAAFGPFNGDLDLRPDGSFTYTPGPGAQGVDSFTYSVFDGEGFEYGQATIFVNGPAEPVDDRYLVWTGEPLVVPSPGVLANDQDGSPRILRARLVDGPDHGEASIRQNGRLRYVPRRGYTGADSLTYEVFDGEFWSGPATVQLQVKSSNVAPEAVADEYVLAEDDPLEVSSPGVLVNDVDGDVGDVLVAELVTGPTIGDLEFNADGSFLYFAYPNYDSPVTFTYRVSDGIAWSAPVEVVIDIYAVNDPPVAEDDSYAGPQDEAIVVGAPGVLGNDYDPVEGDLLFASGATDPPNGTVVMATDGSFTYTPDPGFSGFDFFGYSACDSGGCVSASVYLEIFPLE